MLLPLFCFLYGDLFPVLRLFEALRAVDVGTV